MRNNTRTSPLHVIHECSYCILVKTEFESTILHGFANLRIPASSNVDSLGVNSCCGTQSLQRLRSSHVHCLMARCSMPQWSACAGVYAVVSMMKAWHQLTDVCASIVYCLCPPPLSCNLPRQSLPITRRMGHSSIITHIEKIQIFGIGNMFVSRANLVRHLSSTGTLFRRKYMHITKYPHRF